MASFHFELVSPDKLVCSTAQAEDVLVPGTEGDFLVLRDHAPVMTIVAPRHRRYRRGGRASIRACSSAAALPTSAPPG